MSLDQALPRELLVLAIAHLPERSDVKRLSFTSRFFFSLVRSPELVAAWLWQRKGNGAMRIAMQNDDIAVLRQLIEVQRADVNAFVVGCGLLHEASAEGKLEYVTYLLSAPGIQVNLSSLGMTALHIACLKVHRELVHELLQHPAVDVSIKSTVNDFGALHIACAQGHPEIVAELLGHPGIDVNQTCGPNSWTSLHVACNYGNSGVVRELLKHPDIRVNQKTVLSSGGEGIGALQLCLGVEDDSAREATLTELLKHPGLDRRDVEAVLQFSAAFNRLRQTLGELLDMLRNEH